MTTIGTFTRHDQGFNGTLQTLTFNVKVKIVPIPKDNDKAPDYRVFAGAMEIIRAMSALACSIVMPCLSVAIPWKPKFTNHTLSQSVYQNF